MLSSTCWILWDNNKDTLLNDQVFLSKDDAVFALGYYGNANPKIKIRELNLVIAFNWSDQYADRKHANRKIPSDLVAEQAQRAVAPRAVTYLKCPICGKLRPVKGPSEDCRVCVDARINRLVERLVRSKEKVRRRDIARFFRANEAAIIEWAVENRKSLREAEFHLAKEYLHPPSKRHPATDIDACTEALQDALPEKPKPTYEEVLASLEANILKPRSPL